MRARSILAIGRSLVVTAALAVMSLPALAQGGKVEVTLTNTLAEEVTIIVAAADGSSTREAGKIAPGGTAKVQASPAEYVMLTTGGAPFQNYAVTDVAAQAVSVAKPGAAPAAAAPDPAPAPTVAETPPAPPAAVATTPDPAPTVPAAEAPPAIAVPTSTPEVPPSEQAGPLMGPADVNGLRWQFSKLDGGKGQLVYGVPETDNVQFVATCAAKAKSVDVEFALGTGERKNGAKLSLELKGEAYKAKLSGAVLAPPSGEGLSGMKAKIAAGDKFWDALASERAISYGTGGDRLRLPLDGSRPVVEAFSGHCSGVSPSAALCKKAARLKSVSGGPKLDVTFVNRSDEYRVVFWVDPAGQQVEMGRLESEGGKLPLSTWVGHMFVLTDGPGNCVEVLTATAGATEIDVSAKSPGFGPE